MSGKRRKRIKIITMLMMYRHFEYYKKFWYPCLMQGVTQHQNGHRKVIKLLRCKEQYEMELLNL